MKKNIKIGDVFEIPLSDGRKTYGQYVYWDNRYGPLVQIYDLITRDRATVTQVLNSLPLFPPIIVGLKAAIKTGVWEIIGYSPISIFPYPLFRSALYDSRLKKTGMWYLWDGSQLNPIGYDLPKQYEQLELLVVWSPDDVRERIETGANPTNIWLRNEN